MRDIRLTFLPAMAFLSLAALVCSCGSNGNESAATSLKLNEEYSSLPVITLTAVDTIQSFDDTLPVDLEIAGDKLLVQFALEDTTLRAYDMNSKTRLASFGLEGSGPEDVNSAAFLNNKLMRGDSCIVLHEYSSIMDVSLDDFSVRKTPLHPALHHETSINYFDDCAISYYMMPHDYLFKITKMEPENVLLVPFPFSVSEDNAEQAGRFFAMNIYANKSVNRILISMFYFDAYYVYDFDGNLINEFHLATEDFNMNEAISQFLSSSDSENMMNSYGYANDRNCYFRRIWKKVNPETHRSEKEAMDIIKVDWTGKPVAVIVPSDNWKSFCIDDSGDFIAIVRAENGEESETYHIVKYKPNSKH